MCVLRIIMLISFGSVFAQHGEGIIEILVLQNEKKGITVSEITY